MDPPVNVKLLLAEAFELSRKGDSLEKQGDDLKSQVSNWREHQGKQRQLLRVAFACFMNSVEKLIQAGKATSTDPTVQVFCRDKVIAFMQKADAIKLKQQLLLCELNTQIDYSDQDLIVGDAVMVKQCAHLKSSEALIGKCNVNKGYYCIIFRNTTAALLQTSHATCEIVTVVNTKKQLVKNHVPSSSMWVSKYYFDEVTELAVRVSTDTWIRALSVEVFVRELRNSAAPNRNLDDIFAPAPAPSRPPPQLDYTSVIDEYFTAVAHEPTQDPVTVPAPAGASAEQPNARNDDYSHDSQAERGTVRLSLEERLARLQLGNTSTPEVVAEPLNAASLVSCPAVPLVVAPAAVEAPAATAQAGSVPTGHALMESDGAHIDSDYLVSRLATLRSIDEDIRKWPDGLSNPRNMNDDQFQVLQLLQQLPTDRPS